MECEPEIAGVRFVNVIEGGLVMTGGYDFGTDFSGTKSVSFVNCKRLVRLAISLEIPVESFVRRNSKERVAGFAQELLSITAIGVDVGDASLAIGESDRAEEYAKV